MVPEPASERSLGELLGDLAQETTTLVKQEMQLAKIEMTAKAAKAGRDASVVGAGAALLHAGLLALIFALIIGVSQFVPLWLSALLVGFAVCVGGYVLVQRGIAAIKQIDPLPQATIQTLKEDKTWAQGMTSR